MPTAPAQTAATTKVCSCTLQIRHPRRVGSRTQSNIFPTLSRERIKKICKGAATWVGIQASRRRQVGSVCRADAQPHATAMHNVGLLHPRQTNMQVDGKKKTKRMVLYCFVLRSVEEEVVFGLGVIRGIKPSETASKLSSMRKQIQNRTRRGKKQLYSVFQRKVVNSPVV